MNPDEENEWLENKRNDRLKSEHLTWILMTRLAYSAALEIITIVILLFSIIVVFILYVTDIYQYRFFGSLLFAFGGISSLWLAHNSRQALNMIRSARNVVSHRTLKSEINIGINFLFDKYAVATRQMIVGYVLLFINFGAMMILGTSVLWFR